MTPSDIADLAFHLRSDTGLYTDTAGTAAATADGALVARWSDLGPNGWHVTQATSGNRPTLDAATAFKSAPAVAFDAASSQFLSNAAFSAASGIAAGTWFLCFQAPGTGTSPLVCPSSEVFAVVDDNGAMVVYHHSGAVEYGSHPFYRPAVGKCVLATYDAAGSGSAGRLRVRSNTYDRTLTYPSTPISSTAYTVSPGLWVGRFSAVPAYATASLLEVAFWPRVLTTPERDGLEAYARTAYFGHGRGSVHCVGDSLTNGYVSHPYNGGAGDGLDWPTQLGALLGSGWSVRNNGQVAYSIGQLLAQYMPTVDSDRDEWRDVKNGGLGDIVISQGGTNNIYPGGYWDHDADQTMAEQVASVAHWKGLGFTVLVTTVPHLGSTGPGGDIDASEEAAFAAIADEYNAMILAGDSGADGVIRWDTDPFDDPYNATYFYSGDRIHFEAPLNAEAAQRALDAIGADPDPEDPDPMADTKISELASLTTPATTDLLEVVDVSDTTMAGTGTNKKTTVAGIGTALGVLGSAAIGTTVQAYDADLAAIAALADPNADRILFWDDSAGAYAYLTAGSGLTITGTTMTASGGGGGGASSPLTLTATTASEVPLVTKGAASQTGHLFEVQDSTGTAIFQIDADGSLRRNDGTNMVIRSAGSLDVYLGNVHRYRFNGAVAFQPMDDVIESLGQSASRWLNIYANYHHVCGNSAPADADIAAGQCVVWFDSTNGAAKVMAKGKSANGTVGSAVLATLA